MKKESSEAGATHMKTKSPGVGGGAIFMKRRDLEPELCYFHDGSAALVICSIPCVILL